MTTKWKLLERQGSREVWMKPPKESGEPGTAQYRGEEYTEVAGERQKVDEVETFDTETEALAWLNAGVG